MKTAAKLESAQAERDKTAATVAELRSKRDALDVEADDYATAWQTFDTQIAVNEKSLRILDDQIARLEVKADGEAQAAAAARRAQAIRQAETTILPARMAAIETLAQWARDGVALVDRLETASKLKGWPSDLETPYVDDVRNERMLRAIAAAFSGLGADWHPERATGIIAEAVEVEAEHHRQAIDGLKSYPLPQPETEAEAA